MFSSKCLYNCSFYHYNIVVLRLYFDNMCISMERKSMSVDYKLIGKRIREQRRLADHTQEELAEQLAVTVGYISQIERGITKVSLDTLSNIAANLGCDITELLIGATPRQSSYLAQELAQLYGDMNEAQKRLLLQIAENVSRFPE